MNPRILIAGVGNIFLGDDAFGPLVVRRLAERRLPDGVRVIDFGIRGLELAYALLDGYDAAILVDAMWRGQQPGTLYVVEPEPDSSENARDPLIQTHNLDPAKVLRLVEAMGGRLPWLRIVACEPANLAPGLMELSAPVQAAVAPAVEILEAIVQGYLAAECRPASAR
jgi:hydrogenase maturation protease